MSFASIGAALDARFLTLPGLDTTNISWEGVIYTPTPLVPYMAVQVIGIDRRAIAAGEKAVLEWSGTYQVNSFRPIGEGRGPVSLDVDAILALFPRGLSLTATDGAVVKFEASKPAPLMVNGNVWIQGVARMPFFVHEFPT